MTNASWDNFWKPDWDQTRERLTDWWQHDGFALHVFAHHCNAQDKVVNTQAPFYYLLAGLDPLDAYDNDHDIQQAWLDAPRRLALAESTLANMVFGGDSFPLFDSHLGPGNLATFLGSEPAFSLDTAWFSPCIADPDQHPPLLFDPANPWFVRQKKLMETAMRSVRGASWSRCPIWLKTWIP
jgi:hypothetical protein